MFIEENPITESVFDQDIKATVIGLIQRSTSVRGAMAWLTNRDVFDALGGLRDGFAIFTSDKTFGQDATPEDIENRLVDFGLKYQSCIPGMRPIEPVSMENSSIMHQKFLVFSNDDGSFAVALGSWNATKNAESSMENLTVIYDAGTVNTYLKRFSEMVRTNLDPSYLAIKQDDLATHANVEVCGAIFNKVCNILREGDQDIQVERDPSLGNYLKRHCMAYSFNGCLYIAYYKTKEWDGGFFHFWINQQDKLYPEFINNLIVDISKILQMRLRCEKYVGNIKFLEIEYPGKSVDPFVAFPEHHHVVKAIGAVLNG